MDFLASFRRIFGDDPLSRDPEAEPDSIEALDGDGDPHHAAPAEMAAPSHASSYDRALWRRKLRTHLAEGHDLTGPQWRDFFADARALGLDPGWIEAAKRSELRQLIQAAIHDGVISSGERRHINHVMTLLGVEKAEAVAIFDGLVSEARTAKSKAEGPGEKS